MVFSYEEKVIIKYLRVKYSALRIINDHSEYEGKVNRVKKLLRNMDETGDVARKETSGRFKSVRRKEH